MHAAGDGHAHAKESYADDEKNEDWTDDCEFNRRGAPLVST
jgi:hypothetical protein